MLQLADTMLEVSRPEMPGSPAVLANNLTPPPGGTSTRKGWPSAKTMSTPWIMLVGNGSPKYDIVFAPLSITKENIRDCDDGGGTLALA